MTLDELLALLPDNTNGDITAADLRTIVSELYAPPMNDQLNHPGPFSLVKALSYAPLPAPGPAAGLLTMVESGPVLMSISGYVDSSGHDISMSLELSGATNLAAGAPGKVLRIGTRTAVQCTLSDTFLQDFNEGDTVVEVKYIADASGGTLADLSLTLMALAR